MNMEDKVNLNDEQQIAYTDTGEVYLGPRNEPIQPEVVENKFASPFNSSIGKSSVDLSIAGNNDRMLEEYNNWFGYGAEKGFLGVNYTPEDAKPERNKLRDQWYQKYYGMSHEDYETNKPKVTMYGNEASLEGYGDHLDQIFQGLSAPGLGVADFAMDAVGLLGKPGDWLDDKWDEATKLDNPTHQAIREVSSIVIPSIMTGGATNSILAKAGVNKLPWFAKHLSRLGAWTLESQVIAGISDTSEDDNAARVVSDLLPGVFGPTGWIPLPEAWKTADGDSPGVRKQKNMWEAAALSWVGVALGSFVDMKSLGKTKTKQMSWFKPLDDQATKYYQTELLAGSDNDLLIRIQEINEILSSKKLSKQNERILLNELVMLEDEVGLVNGFDDAIRRSDLRAADEADTAKKIKVENPDQLELDLGIDPDLAPELFDPSTTARQVPPPGNVARNMADTTAIKLGNSTGTPAPVITDAMREKGLMVGDTSRDAVMGVAEVDKNSG